MMVLSEHEHELSLSWLVVYGLDSDVPRPIAHHPYETFRPSRSLLPRVEKNTSHLHQFSLDHARVKAEAEKGNC